jgi:hypothetical protein
LWDCFQYLELCRDLIWWGFMCFKCFYGNKNEMWFMMDQCFRFPWYNWKENEKHMMLYDTYEYDSKSMISMWNDKYAQNESMNTELKTGLIKVHLVLKCKTDWVKVHSTSAIRQVNLRPIWLKSIRHSSVRPIGLKSHQHQQQNIENQEKTSMTWWRCVTCFIMILMARCTNIYVFEWNKTYDLSEISC